MQDALNQLPAELRSLFSRLVDDHQRVLADHQRIVSDHQRISAENQLLRQQLRLMRLEKYGARSEKLSDLQLALLDGEPSVVAAEVQQEAEQPATPVEPKARRQHPGRWELPAHLERKEVVIPCEPKDCVCQHCQQPTDIIGYERTEELDVIPAYYFVKVTLREKRACRRHPEGGVSRAPVPASILPKSKLSNAMIVDTVVKKFGDFLPAYRQSWILQRDARIEISRQTLINAILKVGGLLQALQHPIKTDLFAQHYLQADETPVPCQVPEKTGRNHKAYLWEFSRPGGPALFLFLMSRGREGPKEFLRGYTGILQTDGYAAYDKLGEGIEYAACLAHVRREFHRAHLLQKLDPRPLEILDRIGQLYVVEEQARSQGLTAEQRLALRQEHSLPVFEELGRRILELRAQADVLPSSQLGKACTYALGLWDRLSTFLRHGHVEIDTNLCENSIRPLAVGRKNWLHIGSEQAGPAIAAIASIFETCRRLAINPRDYLLDVLPKLPEWPSHRTAELTPMAWKAARTAS